MSNINNQELSQEEMEKRRLQLSKEGRENKNKYLKELKNSLKCENGVYQFPNGRWVDEQFVYLYDKVFNGRGTVKDCITAHCIDCIYDNTAPGNFVTQIENCHIVSCAMYSVRNQKARALLRYGDEG